MVQTRHSLPTTGRDGTGGGLAPPPPPPPLGNKRLQAALRKLQIDGTAALVADSHSAKETEPGEHKVYHYRGAVYQWTGREPEEWIEGQPERWKKLSEITLMHKPSPPPPPPPPHEAGADARQATPPLALRAPAGARKRKRARRPAVSLEGTQGEVESAKRSPASQPTARVPRLSASSSLPTPFAPRQGPSPAAHSQIARGPADLPSTGDTPRPSRRGSDSSLDLARRDALRKGYQVDPIPQAVIDDNLGRRLRDDVMNLANANSRVLGLVADYRRLKVEWNRLYILRSARLQLQMTPQVPTRAKVTGQLANSGQKRDARCGHSPRMTREVAPGPSASIPTPSPARAQTHTPARTSFRVLKPTAVMPARNKGGQALRWTVDPQQLRWLDGRAERSIFHGRLYGESKAARRRRVEREIALVRGWPTAAARAGRGKVAGNGRGSWSGNGDH